jgi:hypothetical protein
MGCDSTSVCCLRRLMQTMTKINVPKTPTAAAPTAVPMTAPLDRPPAGLLLFLSAAGSVAAAVAAAAAVAGQTSLQLQLLLPRLVRPFTRQRQATWGPDAPPHHLSEGRVLDAKPPGARMHHHLHHLLQHQEDQGRSHSPL